MYGKTIQVFRCRLVIHSSFRVYSSDTTKRLLEFLGNMPKPNTSRIAEAQKQRLNIKKKSEKYSASTVYLQVLGSGAPGAPNALYLFTDQNRYLFNCGEGTQRLAHEHKVKLSRLEHVFITSKTWRNLGGLPGLSLTLQDVGVPNITLHGPEGLDNLYTATKRFVTMKEMNVTMANCTPSQDFQDNVMTVKYVLLGPQEDVLSKEPPLAKKAKFNDDKQYEEFIHDDTDYYKRDRGRRDDNKAKVEKEPLKKTDKILHDLQKLSKCSVAYICTLHKRYGALDLAKCVERGVKPGPLLGELKSGKDVVLPDGTLVLSKDVKTPDEPGSVFIVLEVPEISYLDESHFAEHFADEVNPPERVPAAVAHYSPPHVVRDPRYQAFMQKFGPSTQHLLMNESNSCLGSEAVHRTQHKLHQLSPEMFPLLRDASIPAAWTACKGEMTDKMEELKNKVALAQFQSIVNSEAARRNSQTDGLIDAIEARTLTMFHLRPKRELDRSAEPKLHIQEYIQEALQNEGFTASLEQFTKAADALRSSDLRQYPKVIFLGTGSCIPSKTRNTSGIVLQMDENHSMLLDCGEGTYGQLVRFFGPKRVDAFMRTLKAVYVSHLHADHHIGLIGIIQARQRALEECPDPAQHPLYLLAPGQIMSWLSLYDQQFEPLRQHFTLVPNQSLLHSAETPSQELTPAVLASLNLSKVVTCYVSHCPNAFGVAVTVGRDTVTYSGDTIPCDELVNIGENSTLLIHEATMEDELADEARVKMHSTTSQAIEIGVRMRAKFTVLTHFSQRYARIPRLGASILRDNTSVGIAFDNMQITPTDLELLPLMYAPLQLMFAEHCVEMELKAQHRARHKEKRSISPAFPQPNKIRNFSTHSADKDCISNDLQNATISNGVDNAGHESQKSSSGRSSPIRSISRSRPRSTYIESYASRLRQELKGMSVAGVVRDRSRSNSMSPPSRASRYPSVSSGLSLAKPYSKCSSSRRESTNNLIKDFLEQSRINLRKPSSYVIDSRSKTISSAPSPNVSIGKDVKLLMKSGEPKISDFNTNIIENRHKSLVYRTALNEDAKSGCRKPKDKRSFKPTLDDIQSSNLIMNKPVAGSSKTYNITKPPPVDENARRVQLMETKRRFMSKEYKLESKFARIEGLNWISW